MSNQTSQGISDERFREVLKLKPIRGMLMFTHEYFDPEIIEGAMDYRARDGDIILAAYVKTGSTWLMYMIWEILHKGKPYPDMRDAYEKHIPCVEVAGTEVIDSLQHPRYYKQQSPFTHLDVNKNAKYIYIHRRPDDVIVSFYHYNKMYTDQDYDFDFFFEAFITGNVWYGSMFDHVLAAYAHKDEPNFLFVSYEKLKANTREEVLRVAKFLGENYEKELVNDEALLQKILIATSFDNMKKNLTYDFPVDEKFTGEKKFFRKGIVGDSKNYLSQEQRKRLNEVIKEKMKGTDLVEAWIS